MLVAYCEAVWYSGWNNTNERIILGNQSVKLFGVEDPNGELESLMFINRTVFAIAGIVLSTGAALLFMILGKMILLGFIVAVVGTFCLSFLPVFIDRQKEKDYDSLLSSGAEKLNALGFNMDREAMINLISVRQYNADSEHRLFTQYFTDYDTEKSRLDFYCEKIVVKEKKNPKAKPFTTTIVDVLPHEEIAQKVSNDSTEKDSTPKDPTTSKAV